MIETRFCTKCVISDHRPIASAEYLREAGSVPRTMTFDAEGVCGACRVAERKEQTDWEFQERVLKVVLETARRQAGRYDVLVPGSGGKDSVYASHLLKYKYGMNVLTCTWAPHEYTAVGWRNFQRWLNSGFDNVLVTPNPKVHRLLTKLAFLNLCHPFQPFVLGQRMLARKLASLYNIGMIFFGEDDEEYEGEKGWQEMPESNRFFEPHDEPRGQDTTGKPVHIAGVSVHKLMSEHGLTRADLEIYMPAAPAPWVNVHALGKYVKWQPQEAYYFAVEKTGFEANEARTEGTYSKYNSIDDRLDPLHYYTTFVKFGIGRASYDAAQEIRNGHLTREEGVA